MNYIPKYLCSIADATSLITVPIAFFKHELNNYLECIEA